MPVYEYLCADCRQKSAFLIRNAKDEITIKCNFCSGTHLTRVMSRFASLKSDEDRLESLSDPSRWSGLDENDPKSVATFIKKMGREIGQDASRDDIDRLADEAAHEAVSDNKNATAGKTGLD